VGIRISDLNATRKIFLKPAVVNLPKIQGVAMARKRILARRIVISTSFLTSTDNILPEFFWKVESSMAGEAKKALQAL
jgi:hypothetical protein